VENLQKNDVRLVRELLATAERLAADDGGEEKEDPRMNEKLRNLKPLLPKLNAKRNKTLKQMGIQQNIKTTTKVEELVDMLMKMVTT
jgi:hypothetical protein